VSGPQIGPSASREPEHPHADPWGIVHLVMHDLAAHGIKSRFGDEADTATAVRAAALVLDALGIRPRIPDDDKPAAADDERIQSALALLAENIQPLTMTPGDLRNLIGRYRRRVVALLEALGQETGS
jgi:hypothetical protein